MLRRLRELPPPLLRLPRLKSGAEVEVAAEDVELDPQEEVKQAEAPSGGERPCKAWWDTEGRGGASGNLHSVRKDIKDRAS